MAHPEDLEKLRQGPRAWNAWRQVHPDHVPDLRDAELTMSQRQFGPASGGPIDLSDADLQGMVLRHSTLTDASLVRANLIATDLVQARLEGANLAGADLTDAVLDYSDLTGADLNGTILVGASLVNVKGLTQDQIEQTRGDASTALPANLLPPESWFPPLEGSMFEEYDKKIDLSPLSTDPYEVLGVHRNATFDEIRTAFRTLVKKLHPDLNPDDSVAQERFKRVSIAYRILSDPVKRNRYDRGKIDANGDIHPDVVANKEFRRYAYKFYAAAAASLLVAAGILGAVWQAFWVQDVNSPPGTPQIAEARPPKRTERLNELPPFRQPEQPVQSVEVDEVEVDELAVSPEQIAAVAAAVEASKKLTTANTQNDTAGAPLAAGGSALRPVPQSPGTVQRGITPEQLPKINTNISPSQTPGNELNAVKPALTNERDKADLQEFASRAPTEAVKISQRLSSDNNAKIASNIKDENNKLATLIKDIKTLAADKPLFITPYQPQWPSAHNVVLKNRQDSAPTGDDITDVFRKRAKYLINDTANGARIAASADSLQVTRQPSPASKRLVAVDNNIVEDPGSQETNSPDLPLGSDVTTFIQLRPVDEHSVVVRAP